MEMSLIFVRHLNRLFLLGLLSASLLACVGQPSDTDEEDVGPGGGGGGADVVAPSTSISNSPAAISNVSSPTFEFSATDDNSGVAEIQFQINGSGFSACASPCTLNPLPDGNYTIQFQAIDNAGNIENPPVEYNWQIDTASPAEPTLTSTNPLTISDDSSPNFLGTSEANSVVTIYSDSSCTNQIATGSADGAGSFDITGNVPSKDSDISYYAIATDTAGNSSSCSTSTVSYQAYSVPIRMGFFQATESNAAATPTNFNQSTEASLNWSFARIDRDYFSHSTTTNAHQITVTQTGTYFLNLAMPLQGSLTRGTIRAEVKVDGTVVQGSRAESSYIRNADAHTESSNHLSLALNLAANQVVEVTVIRTAGGGTITTSSKVNLTMEFRPAGKNIFSATATQTTSSTNLNGTIAPMSWTPTINTGGYTHNAAPNPENIQLDTSGHYYLAVNIPLTSTATRTNIKLEVHINGTKITGGSGAQGYIRNSSGHNDSSIHFAGVIPNVTAGEVLTIQVQREANSGTTTVPAGQAASISLEYLDSQTGQMITDGTDLASGTNWNPAAKDSILWANNTEIDTVYFNHTAPSQSITIRTDGDYFISYNDYLNGSLQRGNPKITVEVDGVAAEGLECKSHYIRNTSGHNDSSCSMSSLLRGLVDGNVLTINAIQEARAGTINDADNALLFLWHKPYKN